MKKKLILVLTVCALAVGVTACGSKNTGTETTAQGAQTESSQAGSKAEETGTSTAKNETESAAQTSKEESKPDFSKLDPEETKGPGSEEEEENAEEQNKNFEDLESSDYKAFAKQIVDAVTAKDMNTLADLMSYPSYVACVKENDGIVDSRESFMAQDPEAIFDADLVAAMQKADLESLEPLMAGVIIGEDTPNIIFKSVDGKLGIVGIHY